MNRVGFKDKKHSKESKEKISKARKLYLKSKGLNGWSFCQRGKVSYPEKIFGQALMELGITAIQSYIPPENDRLFEIDFALVNEKIAFEVNGSQHYEDGNLKKYYQDRHQYLLNKGWIVHEIHFHECMKIERAKETINKCINIENCYSSSAEIISWKDVKKQNKYKEDLIKAKNRLIEYKNQFLGFEQLCWALSSKEYEQEAVKFILSQRLKWCLGKENLKIRKAIRPSKEELEKMVWEEPSRNIAKRYGVNDTAIVKWCKIYQISKPPRGYWNKVFAKKT